MSQTHLGQTEKARVAVRETKSTLLDLDVFMNVNRSRATETVADAQRALKDVLPPNTTRPTVSGNDFFGRVTTKTQHNESSNPLSPNRVSHMQSASPIGVPTFEPSSPPPPNASRSSFDASPPPSTSGHTSDVWSPYGSAQSTRSSHRTPARPLPPEGGEGFRAREVGEKVFSPSRINSRNSPPRDRNADTRIDNVRIEDALRKKRERVDVTKSPNRTSNLFSDTSDDERSDTEADENIQSPIVNKATHTPRSKPKPKLTKGDNALLLADMAATKLARARVYGIGATLSVQSNSLTGDFAVHPFKTMSDETIDTVFGDDKNKKSKSPRREKDELTRSLELLLERLSRTKINGTSRFKLSKANRIDELLGTIESVAAARVQAAWRGFEVRREVPKIRIAIEKCYRKNQRQKFHKAFTFWKQHTTTRRMLRTRARGLTLKHGARAHYYLGLRLSDSVDDEKKAGGSCDAYDYESEFGKLGVAKRFREWRFVAFAFCRWRYKVAFG